MNGNTVRFSLHESARLGHLPGLFNPHLQKWLHLDLQPHGARGGSAFAGTNAVFLREAISRRQP
jgi:hypothetical protein